MEKFKKHYEKFLLGAVLLGLTVAACLLPFYISKKRADLESKRNQNLPKVKELPAVDMVENDAAIQRAQSNYKLDFTTKHNLLNPVLWKKFPDGRLIKEQTGNEEGPGALVVTDIKPLYLQIAYSAPSGTGYKVTFDRPAETKASKMHGERILFKDQKGDLATLKEVKGSPDKPTELILELSDSDELISLTPDKPIKKVESYSADLKYPLESNKVWTNRRTNSVLTFAGGQYIAKIVAISASNVVVSAEPNQKKTTLPFPVTEPR